MRSGKETQNPLRKAGASDFGLGGRGTSGMPGGLEANPKKAAHFPHSLPA